MTTGDSKSGLYFSIVLIKFAVLSGENLQALLKEVDRHIGIVTCFHYTVVLSHLMAYRETVSTLIDKGHHTRSENNTKDPYEGVSTSSAIEVEKLKERLKESIFTNRTLQAFWRGQVQRCHHFATKGAGYQAGGQQSKLIISFYSALNSFRGIKNKNGCGSQFSKVKRTFKDAVVILRPAAELCPWNFRNKVILLEAEMHSFEKRNEQARISYAAAIASARSSRFTHEQGLACELAGSHYTKIGDTETALTCLQQAKECYQLWGSQMKVESINKQIENVSPSLR